VVPLCDKLEITALYEDQLDDLKIFDRLDRAVFRVGLAAAKRDSIRAAGEPIFRYLLFGKHPKQPDLAARSCADP
jgi:hypothetical protein